MAIGPNSQSYEVDENRAKGLNHNFLFIFVSALFLVLSMYRNIEL